MFWDASVEVGALKMQENDKNCPYFIGKLPADLIGTSFYQEKASLETAMFSMQYIENYNKILQLILDVYGLL